MKMEETFKKVIFGVIPLWGSFQPYHLIKCKCGTDTWHLYVTNITKVWQRYHCDNCGTILYDRYLDKKAPDPMKILLEEDQYRILNKQQTDLYLKMEKLVV